MRAGAEISQCGNARHEKTCVVVSWWDYRIRGKSGSQGRRAMHTSAKQGLRIPIEARVHRTRGKVAAITVRVPAPPWWPLGARLKGWLVLKETK